MKNININQSLSSDSESRVAVLLCTYNGTRFLKEQIDSIGRQTHSNIVLVASDDGSKDGTLAMLEDYRARWGGDRVIILKGPSRGFSKNFLSMIFNPSIQADYYAFADQDDIWEENKISRAVAMMAATASAPSLYFSRTQLVDIENKDIGLSPLVKGIPDFTNSLVQNVARGNTMVVNDAARQLLQIDQNVTVYAHDWWVYQVITGCGGKVYYDAVPTLRYRQHGSNLIGANKGIMARLLRLKLLFDGSFRSWNSMNIAALKKFVPLFPEENKNIFGLFCAARQTWIVPRVSKMLKSGVRRESAIDNLALLMATIMGRV